MIDDEVLLEAFAKFLEEPIQMADTAGYEVDMSAEDNKIYIDVTTVYSMMPTINVYPRQKEPTVWNFVVDVEFPDIDLDKSTESAVEILESWRDAAELADYFENIQFDCDLWV